MKLAEIQTINEITPIEGADRIELAKVQGWQSVVARGTYSVGDRIVFIPIDTVLRPETWNSFLHDKKDPTTHIRVKSVKLKGVYSSGLIFRIEDIFEVIEKNGKKYINIDESKHSVYEDPNNLHISNS